MRYQWLWLLLSVPWLSGCQPAYVSDTVQQWSRSIGVTDRYVIQRQSTFVIARGSSLQVASPVLESIDENALTALIVQSLQPRFASVSALPANSRSRAVAESSADFLVFVRSLENQSQPDSVVAVEEGQSAAIESNPDSDRYQRIVLLLDIVDVSTGTVFDSIQITASGKAWKAAQSMPDLLEEAMAAMARLVSGQTND